MTSSRARILIADVFFFRRPVYYQSLTRSTVTENHSLVVKDFCRLGTTCS